MDGCKRFGGRDGCSHPPIHRRHAPGRAHHLNAFGVDVHLRALKAVDKTVDGRRGAARWQGLHDALFFGRGNDQALLPCHQKITACLAVRALRQLVEEVSVSQRNDASQRPDAAPRGIPDRCGDANHRHRHSFVHDRGADHGLTVLHRHGHGGAVYEVDASAPQGAGCFGHRRAIGAGNEHAPAEQAGQQGLAVQKVLQPGAVGHRFWPDAVGQQRQCLDALVQMGVGSPGDEGHHRQLLLAQLLLHVLAQHPAGIQGQRPQAGDKNHQHEQRDAGLERARDANFGKHGVRVPWHSGDRGGVAEKPGQVQRFKIDSCQRLLHKHRQPF